MLHNKSIPSFKYLEGGLREKIKSFNLTQKYSRSQGSDNSPWEMGEGRILIVCMIVWFVFFLNYDVEIIENINFNFVSFFFFALQDRNAALTAVGADLCALTLTKFLNRSNVRNLSEVSKLVFKSSVFRYKKMLNFQS